LLSRFQLCTVLTGIISEKKSLENISLLVRPARIRTGLVFERPGVNVFPEMFWDKFLHQDILGQLGHPVAQRVRIGQVERDRIFLTELSESSNYNRTPTLTIK